MTDCNKSYEKAREIAIKLVDALGENSTFMDKMAGISLFVGATLDIAKDHGAQEMIWDMFEGIMIRSLIGDHALSDPYKAMNLCKKVRDLIKEAYEESTSEDENGDRYKIID